MAKPQNCPECACNMTVAFDVPTGQTFGAGVGRMTVPFASAIYQCPKHGYWRIDIADNAAPVRLVVSGKTHANGRVVRVLRFNEGGDEYYMAEELNIRSVGRHKLEADAQAEADRIINHDCTPACSPWTPVDAW